MAKAIMNDEWRTLYLARALYDAVEDCNIQQVNTLLSQNKANPNILIPEEGMTAFHLAAGHENLAFGKIATSLFLHNGGDPNVLCEGNRTVLHIAVAWNRSQVVGILLKSPYIIPNPYIKDEDNLNVFNYAVKFSAWESLATLQSYMKNYTSNLKKQVSDVMQSKHIKEKYRSSKKAQNIEKSIDAESTFDKSDKLCTNSGYLNSSESLDSISKSTFDSVGQKNNNIDECILTSTAYSFDDILNKNVSSDNHITGLHVKRIPSKIYYDGSMLSSIKCVSDEFESIENISFPSSNLLSDSELYEHNEVELGTKNIFSQVEDTSLSDSDLMSDISGLSSLSSDDFLTCTDTNSERQIRNSVNSVTYKTDIELEDVTKSLSTTSIYGSISNSTSKTSAELNNLEVSNIINSLDECSCSLVEISDCDTDYIRESLRECGYPPGPIVPSTKQVYVRKLNQILQKQTEEKHDDKPINNSSGSYSMQLTKVLADDAWKKTIKSWSILEDSIVSAKSGSSFTYLLLDPRITNNLPVRANEMNPIEIWQTFIRSIFYIGKGTKSRPNDHMNEAFKAWVENKNQDKSRKTEYILSLWKEKLGVVCVQAFHHLMIKEAHIREAAMIDAIGLDKLTNEKRGTYYDNTARWLNSDRCKLGCHLLYRAMLVFLADGERQLRPVDLT
ncbi:uncharacterized protein LOC112598258 [Melanaphis sacchari]|uniref:Ankyrin repeat and LEM domain-containing protein 1 n=1 Tax=Melanaphis sacchari TaxID=742174 RepID=A0A2H8TEG3_9HEMI|nr:uncharacterized protein LOC112598258 [Melanaphis sacchari]